MMNTRPLTLSLLAVGLLTLGLAGHAAGDLPGKGVKVLPLQSNLVEETFQTLLVSRALEKLGYDVSPIKRSMNPDARTASNQALTASSSVNVRTC